MKPFAPLMPTPIGSVISQCTCTFVAVIVPKFRTRAYTRFTRPTVGGSPFPRGTLFPLRSVHVPNRYAPYPLAGLSIQMSVVSHVSPGGDRHGYRPTSGWFALFPYRTETA